MPILPHACVPERDPRPSGGGRVRAFGSVDEPRIVDSRAADDFASFAEACAELSAGPVVVLVDEVAALYDAIEGRREAALMQRTELHLDLPDALLTELALAAGGAR